jgi:rSAM/selenodomain-associated transferase 1
MNTQVLLMAKEPVPGRVKTRLCPPCTHGQAAAVAAAALRDTVDAVDAAPVTRRTLVVSGRYETPPAWSVVAQRGQGLGQRLAHAFADTACADAASLLIGMDTPQVTPGVLVRTAGLLREADAVLGPAEDGGWWALALSDPRHADVLAGVPMSTPDTCALTAAALRGRGLTVATTASLRDVDTAADAWAVAALCSSGRFADAVRTCVPRPERR